MLNGICAYLRLLSQIPFFMLKGKVNSENLDRVASLKPVSFPHQNAGLHGGFVNSPKNEKGLKAEFFEGNSREAYCQWKNTASHFSGFPNIIHGGILVSLADELMANCLVSGPKRLGLSVNMTAQWVRPVFVGDSIFGHAKIQSRIGRFVYLSARLHNGSGKCVFVCTAVFYLPTLAQFERATKQALPAELHAYVGG